MTNAQGASTWYIYNSTVVRNRETNEVEVRRSLNQRPTESKNEEASSVLKWEFVETHIRIVSQLGLVEEVLELLLTLIRERRYGWRKPDVLDLLVYDAIRHPLLPNLPDRPLIQNEHVEER